MTADQIIELGTKLGLPFNRRDNYEEQLAKDVVVFNGINSQRFLIDGKLSDDEIYKLMGKSLIRMGERKKKMEIHQALNISSD